MYLLVVKHPIPTEEAVRDGIDEFVIDIWKVNIWKMKTFNLPIPGIECNYSGIYLFDRFTFILIKIIFFF